MFRVEFAACALLVLACAAPSNVDARSAWHSYRDMRLGYAISYPPAWRLDTAYAYTGLGPQSEIRGVAFHIPPSMTQGTNLSPNLTGVSVETSPGSCRADRFLEAPEHLRALRDNGIAYSIAEGEDAGAGNFYQQVIYAVVASEPCLAVRYFIHSTNIGNYDPGTVRQFDRAALMAQFDRIRRTLVLRQPAHPRAKPQ
jgi:hypothetical protein